MVHTHANAFRNSKTVATASVHVSSLYFRVLFVDGNGEEQWVIHTDPNVSVKEMVERAGGDFNSALVEHFSA